MKETARIIIPIAGNKVWERPARSLRWRGDTLIDWASGGVRYELDGSCSRPAIHYAYPFDHAAVSSDGLYVAIVTRLGTKGLLLKDGRIIREINRSFYYANAYEYPIAFLNLPDGGTAIAHCPDEYCKLEIEEVESGKRLTSRTSKPRDFFHSRLMVSSDNRFLVSAGWIWHPFDDALVYDLGRAIEQPESLDADTSKDFPLSQSGVMITSAAFAESGFLVVTATDDYYDPDDIDPTEQDMLGYYQIGVYDLYAKSFRRKAQLTEPAGELMPLGENYAIGFYQHPKLIDLETGAILRKWEELNSGDQLGSIIWHQKKLPPLALDPVNKRFAVASEREITVIQLG
jgi:hypothetical protein